MRFTSDENMPSDAATIVTEVGHDALTINRWSRRCSSYVGLQSRTSRPTNPGFGLRGGSLPNAVRASRHCSTL